MAELACVYAALILNDEGLEITAEKMNKLIDAAGVKIESYWVDLFAEYFKGQNVDDLIKGGCIGGAAAPVAAAGAAAAEEKQEEKKKEEEEVVEMAGGFDDLFG